MKILMSPFIFVLPSQVWICWCRGSAGLKRAQPSQLNGISYSHRTSSKTMHSVVLFSRCHSLDIVARRWEHQDLLPKEMHLFHFHTTVMNLFTWFVYILYKCMCVWAKERVCERRWNPTVFCPLSEPFILAHVLRHPFHPSKAWCVAHMANKRVPNTCQ